MDTGHHDHWAGHRLYSHSGPLIGYVETSSYLQCSTLTEEQAMKASRKLYTYIYIWLLFRCLQMKNTALAPSTLPGIGSKYVDHHTTVSTVGDCTSYLYFLSTSYDNLFMFYTMFRIVGWVCLRTFSQEIAQVSLT